MESLNIEADRSPITPMAGLDEIEEPDVFSDSSSLSSSPVARINTIKTMVQDGATTASKQSFDKSPQKEASKEKRQEQDEGGLKPVERKSILEMPQKNKRYDGSLLRLFKSDFFNIHMLLHYLYKKDEVGIVDYLINRLYSAEISDIEFYAPQLCYMMLYKEEGHQTLERLILYLSIHHQMFALQALLHLNSYAEDVNSKFREKAEKLHQMLEMVIVNGKLPQKYESLHRPGDEDDMISKFHEKKYREEYLSLQHDFLGMLKHYSLKLNELKPENRKDKLKDYLKRTNDWMNEEIRSKHMDAKYEICNFFKGVALPFSEGADKDPTIILGTVVEEAHCFSTKKRAPIKVVFETIKLSEVKDWDMKIKKEKKRASEKISSKFKSIKHAVARAISNEKDVVKKVINKIIKHDGSHHKGSDPDDMEEAYAGLAKYARFAEMRQKADQQQKLLSKQNKYKRSFSVFELINHRLFETNALRNMTRSHSSVNLHTHKIDAKTEEIKKAEKMIMKRLSSNEVDALINKFSRKNTDGEGSLRKLQTNDLEEPVGESPHEDVEDTLESDNDDEEEEKFERKPGVHNLKDQMEDPFKDRWEDRKQEIKAKSPYGVFSTYELKIIIFKGDDDLRQEHLAMQMIKRFKTIFDEAGLALYLRPYQVLVTSQDSGMIECLPDTISVDGLKKKFPQDKKWTLDTFYRKYFVYNFEEAQKNFVESLAAYCVVSYILNIKDRHNGNVLIDAEGHIIHIDFGFMLSNSPGSVNFESAPFKLTQEYVDIMGGLDGEIFYYFKSLIIKGLMEVRKHIDTLFVPIEMMFPDSTLPCFYKGDALFNELKQRISIRINIQSPENEYMEIVEMLIEQSYENWWTNQYDNFQWLTNGIYK